jgi:hypothetical protein
MMSDAFQLALIVNLLHEYGNGKVPLSAIIGRGVDRVDDWECVDQSRWLYSYSPKWRLVDRSEK